MNPNRFVLVSLALGGLVAAAGARSTAAEQRKRLEDFQAKAKQARQAQKLDRDRSALVARYPTPELDFNEHPPEVRPGTELTVSGSGSFAPGSLTVVPCEGIEVLSTEVTARRAQARVRVAPDALPILCDLEVVTPVSGIVRSTPALRVTGNYVWELTLSNGLTTRWNTHQEGEDTQLVGSSEWLHQGKSLGTRPLSISLSPSGAHAAVEGSEQDAQAQQAASSASDADMQALGKKMDALMKKAEAECSKVADEKRQECEAKYGAQLQALQEQTMSKAQKSVQAAQASRTPCAELELKAAGGTVTGTASGCGGAAAVTVRGTYKFVGAK